MRASLPLLGLWLCLLISKVAVAAPRDQLVSPVRVQEGDDIAWAAPAFDDSSWPQKSPWTVDPGGGMVWLRAHVGSLEQFEARGTPLAVHVMMAASWELYWNGVLIGSNGIPAATPSAETPGRIQAEVFIPPGLVRRDDNVLALRISSQHRGGRLVEPIQFLGVGIYGSSVGNPWPARVLPLLATGPLLLGATYFAVMFLLNRRDRAPLLLSLLALTVLGQLLVESVRAFYAYPYPLHVPRLQAILVLAALAALLLVAYVARFHARRFFVAALGLTLVSFVLAALFVPGYDAKTVLTLFIGFVVALVVSLAGSSRRIAGSGATAIALALVLLVQLFGATSFLDLGYYVSATALLLFLFARQAVELRRSQRVAGAAAVRSVQLELELLKQQIQPHFLMNTLTALAEWVESSPRTGVRMIEALAAEFRAVAAMSGRSVVMLREELELCRHHLELMGFRGNQPYALKENGVDPDALLPPAVLHTLLENALTHNRYAQGATFVLEARRVDNEWSYRLTSPREGTVDGGPGAGTGHEYVRARLRAAFGDAARFRSAALSSTQWEDVIIVPASVPS